MTPGPAPTLPLIRARAPLHIDLAGGDGIDRDGTAILATITLAAQVDALLGGRTIRLRAEDGDERVTLSSPAAIAYDGRLDRPKAALNMLPVTGGIELLTRADAPHDAGLGVSGALDLALLAALALCRRQAFSPAELAELAWTLELTELKQPMRPQDTYVPAFGGVQLVTWRERQLEGRALPMSERGLADLSAHLIVAYLGRAYASGIARNGTSPAGAADTAATAAAALDAGDWPALARQFDACWQQQQRLDPLLASSHTQALAAAARSGGAWGLKVTTARSGGSLLVLCDRANRPAVEAALRRGGARPLACAISPGGVAAWVESESP